jgi:hypothetical protein
MLSSLRGMSRLGLGDEGWTEIPLRSPTAEDDSFGAEDRAFPADPAPFRSFGCSVPSWRLVAEDGRWTRVAVFRVVVESLAVSRCWELDVRWSKFLIFCREQNLPVPWSVPFPTVWGDVVFQARKDFLQRHLAALDAAAIERFVAFVGAIAEADPTSFETTMWV